MKKIASTVAWIIAGIIAFGAIWTLFCVSLSSDVGGMDVIDHGEFYGIPAEGVGREPNAQATHTTHGDALDYNINTTLWGWDGHGMEVWEWELLSRIVYLEFNGVEPECMNAGIDSILNLWDSGYFGNTLFGLLSATAENGALVYTTYGYVWEWDYDYAVLNDIKAMCMERFIDGPQYGCHFFQLYCFPWWAEPLYEIDSVYFSTFKEGTR